MIAEGPYGALTATARRRRRVLLIAGGTGITPLRALLESLPADPGELTLIYRVSSLRDAVFRAEIEQIAARRQARAWFVAGDRDALPGDPLSGTELARRVPGLTDHDVYLCGPPGFSDAVAGQLRSAGVGRRHIHRESFDFQAPKGTSLRRVILAICATAVGLVLLLSFKTHSPAVAGPRSAAPETTPRRRPGPRPALPAAGLVPGTTVTGAAWPTIYGPVQVRITVSGGKVIAASAIEYPTGTPQRRADQRLRDPPAQRRGGRGRRRPGRLGLRRHLHLTGLRRLAAERPRQGQGLLTPLFGDDVPEANVTWTGTGSLTHRFADISSGRDRWRPGDGAAAGGAGHGLVRMTSRCVARVIAT